MGKINMNGGESCWADSTITNMITLDENNIKMFVKTPEIKEKIDFIIYILSD